MKILITIVVPLLMTILLSSCSSPIDEDTQAKARTVNLANAVRHPNDNTDNDDRNSNDMADENIKREAEAKDD